MTVSPLLGTVLSCNVLNATNIDTWPRCARTYSDVGAVLPLDMQPTTALEKRINQSIDV